MSWLIKFIGVILLLNVILYIIGSFIAYNWNPLEWWLFKETFGRVCFILIEIFGIFGGTIKNLDQKI